MNFLTFLGIIIIIGVTGDALKKVFQGYSSRKDNEINRQKIKELTQRLNELEHMTDIKKIEKRLQALEEIVVDSDYILNSKFKKAFG